MRLCKELYCVVIGALVLVASAGPVCAQKAKLPKALKKAKAAVEVRKPVLPTVERAVTVKVTAQLEIFIKEKGRFPSRTTTDKAERTLRISADNAYVRRNLEGVAADKLLALREQYLRNKKTPQEIIVQIKAFIEKEGRFPSATGATPQERSLRVSFDRACVKAENAEDEISRELMALKTAWVKKRTRAKTPQEWLHIIERWIKEHGRWPLSSVEEEKPLFYGAKMTMERQPNDPASVQMRKLQKQYKTTQQAQMWMEMIESWVLEHKRWPSSTGNEEEKKLYRGAYNVVYYSPKTSLSERLRELREQYDVKIRKTPQKWLNRVEPWVKEHGRWPSARVAEEKPLYRGAYNVIYFYPDDPASVRLKELQAQYK